MINPWILTLIIFLIICIMYIFYFYIKLWLIPSTYPHKELSDVSFKTGDIILFRSFITRNLYDFAYSIITTELSNCIWGHGAIVVMVDNKPYIFEAVSQYNKPVYDIIQNKKRHGMVLTPLEDRIKEYEGIILHAPLKRNLTTLRSEDEILEFVGENSDNMYEVTFTYMMSTLFKSNKCIDNGKDSCFVNTGRFLHFLGVLSQDECFSQIGPRDIYKIIKTDLYEEPHILINDAFKIFISY